MINVFLLIARRILLATLTLAFVSLVIFLVVNILPGDAASRVLGRQATPESLAALRQQMHLGDPAIQRYFRWLLGMIQGDFGTSLVNSRSVAALMRPRIANTLILAAAAFALYVPLALVPAVVQATHRDSALDQALSAITLILLSVPDFLLATIFLIIFVVVFPILPSTSNVDIHSSMIQYARALVMPAMTLSVVMSVWAIRMLRDNLIEVLDSEYVRMADLKGLPTSAVLLRHALPNALIPTLNITALNLGYLIGGVVIVERVFSFPGFGSLLVDAVQLQDVPLIEATVLLAAAVYIFSNLLADLGAILLNPRLRTR